jgi:P27 family predicted phage terminase small subunit
VHRLQFGEGESVNDWKSLIPKGIGISGHIFDSIENQLGLVRTEIGVFALKKSTATEPAPPTGLSTESKAIWRELVADYGVKDSAGCHVLRAGLEAHDRMRAAQKAIEKDGATVMDRWGQVKAHPLLSVERDARAQFMAAMKQLNFDLEPLRDRNGRPAGRRRGGSDGNEAHPHPAAI